MSLLKLVQLGIALPLLLARASYPRTHANTPASPSSTMVAAAHRG
jgi:hypothetical protein